MSGRIADMKQEGEVSISLKKEDLERIERISKASGLPVRELIEKAITQYLEQNKPKEQ